MGAWGHDPFENDDALDLLDSIAEKEFDFEEFRGQVDGGDGAVESSDGEVIVALAALSRIVHDNAPVPEDVEDYRKSLKRFRKQLTPDRRRWVQEQLNRVLGSTETSELRALWEDTADLDKWLAASRGDASES